MQAPLTAGPNLGMETWQRLRLRAIFDYCKWDSQCGDAGVLAKFPLFLSVGTLHQLAELAEALAREALEAEKEILLEPGLLMRLSIPTAVRNCLCAAREAKEAKHVRVMRFDFHYTTQGWLISEVTPMFRADTSRLPVGMHYSPRSKSVRWHRWTRRASMPRQYAHPSLRAV